MYVRQAKQFMRNVDSTFDERKFGFASIVDLLRACQREGLFRIERDRQGVIRLFQGNVMQGAEGETVEQQPSTPGAPRPWQPGDDIPDIHDDDRDVEAAAEVVEGDVVREVETPEVLDGQAAGDEEPADEQPQPEPKKRGRSSRAKSASGEPRAAKTSRARKTPSTRQPRAAKSTRSKKSADVTAVRGVRPRSDPALATLRVRPAGQTRASGTASKGSRGSSSGASISSGSIRLWTLAPSSRTGRLPASVFASSATARRAIVSAIAGRRLGVAARHGREIRIADLDRHRPAQQGPLLQPGRAIARHLVDRRADLVEVGQVADAKVFSLPDDFGS